MLTVEDNPVDARVCEHMFRQIFGERLDSVHVKTLREALSETRRRAFDVILLDLGLPDSHGLGTLAIIQRNTKETPIIVVTGYDDVDFGLRALRMGAKGYLFKNGLELITFQRAVERALGLRPSGISVGIEATTRAADDIEIFVEDAVEEEQFALPRTYGQIYRAERVLGGGTMGTVYYGVDTELDREVAIKVLRPVPDMHPSPEARFDREAKTLAQLEHESIVPIYAFGREHEERYFVMPYVRGKPLASALRGEPRSIRWFLPYLRSICDALSYAHEMGVVHRDLKPANIILSPRGEQAKLLDFGIAMNTTKSRMTQHGVIVGTPCYMSPEQAFDVSSVGPASDQYAIAVVLYEVLAGRPPFEADDAGEMLYKHLSEAPEPLHHLNQEVSEEVSAIVARALSKKPGERYASCREFADELIQAVERPRQEDESSSEEVTRVAPELIARLAEVAFGDKETIPNTKIATEQVDLNAYVPDGFMRDVVSGARDKVARTRLSSACDQLAFSYQASVRSARRVFDLFLMDQDHEEKVFELCSASVSFDEPIIGPTVRALLAEHLAGVVTSLEVRPNQRLYDCLGLVSSGAELPVWEQLLTDPDSKRRLRAIRAVHHFFGALDISRETSERQKVTQILFWAAEEIEESSSLPALVALARIGVPESAELLIQRYKTASSNEVRHEILDALSDLYDDENLPFDVKEALQEELERSSGRPSGVELTVRAKLAALAATTEEDLNVRLVPRRR